MVFALAFISYAWNLLEGKGKIFINAQGQTFKSFWHPYLVQNYEDQ